MGISFNNYWKDKILLTLSNSFEIFRNGKKPFQLGEILHSDFFDRRPELQLLLSVYQLHLNCRQILIESLG